MTPKKKNRVLVYIDGFNLYFGMTEAGYLQCKWLDINKLIKYFLKPDQEVVKVKFFTSRISQNPQKQKRQTIYLEAIETSGLKLFTDSIKQIMLNVKNAAILGTFPMRK